MKKFLLKPSGEKIELYYPNRNMTLNELYTEIGCTTVEHISLGKGVHMWVDEEGLLKGGKPNAAATEIYANKFFPYGTVIVGNAVIEDNRKNS